MALAFIETIYKEQSFEDLPEDLYYYYIPYEEIEAETEDETDEIYETIYETEED